MTAAAATFTAAIGSLSFWGIVAAGFISSSIVMGLIAGGFAIGFGLSYVTS